MDDTSGKNISQPHVTGSLQAQGDVGRREDKYYLLFEMESDAIIVVDNRTLLILEANQAATQLYGYSRDELLRMRNRDLSAEPDETERTTQRKLTQVPLRYHRKRDGTVFPVEITARHLTWDGTSIHIAAIRDITARMQVEQAREKTTEHLELLVRERTAELRRANEILIREITERKDIEEALRVSEEKYRGIVENTLELIMLMQPDGTISYLSPSCREILGCPPEELMGIPPEVLQKTLIHEDDLPNVRQEFGEALTGKKVSGFEYRVRLKSGQVKWVSHSCRTIFRDDQAQVMVNVIHDITKLRHTAEILAQTEKLAAAGQLAARVAHEINNPLAGIKNSFQLVKTAVPPEHPYFPYVGRIEREIDRIAGIVRQLFELYRPEQEFARPFQVDETLHEILALLEPTCRDYRVPVTVETNGLRDPVALSENLVRQVLFNVIKNAIEASPPGAPVRVTAEHKDGRLVFTIRDRGAGIAPDIRSRVFEPFFTTKAHLKAAGLGLGLAISKSIVESMSGTIDFQSPSDEGTLLQIALPLTENNPCLS